MLDLREEDGAVLLPVKVVPGASRTRYLGLWARRARIAVAAPAEKGKANQMLTKFLADFVGVGKGNLRVVSGGSTPLKIVRIDGVTRERVRAAFHLNET